MWFHIDPSNGIPIYVQLIEQIKKAIATGLLNPGEQLPSVRELAVELTVNPNTVSKAYQDLEREGLIETLRGRGTFVSQKANKQGPEERKRALHEAVHKFLIEVHHFQASQEEIEKIFHLEVEKWFKK